MGSRIISSPPTHPNTYANAIAGPTHPMAWMLIFHLVVMSIMTAVFTQ